MNKIFSLMLLCATVFFTSCTKEADSPILVTDITLDHTTLSMDPGESVTLKATLAPDNALVKEITWMSCEPSIATVSPEGVVTAIKAGEVTITAVTTSGGKHASCVVTVKSFALAGEWVSKDATEGITAFFEEKADLDDADGEISVYFASGGLLWGYYLNSAEIGKGTITFATAYGDYKGTFQINPDKTLTIDVPECVNSILIKK